VIDIDMARHSPAPVRGLDAAGAELTYLDSPYRGIPSDANGAIDAAINPLAANRGGRPLANGVTASLETKHSAPLGQHAAAMLNPRVTAWSTRGGANGSNVVLQSGTLNLLFGNFAIEAGRDYTIFGQSPSGGLLLSNNAPTLDMVRISNDRPASLPWWFRVLGPASGTLFVADFGDKRQIHPRAKLAGYHVAFLPNPRFEFGAEVLDAMGGRGGQPASFGDRIVDAVPLIDAIFRSGTDFEFSNKMAGIDFHWRMPSWQGFELYGEGGCGRLRYSPTAQRAARGQWLPARRISHLHTRLREPRCPRRISSNWYSVLHTHRLPTLGARHYRSAIRWVQGRSQAT
jgi:hypothetical protein